MGYYDDKHGTKEEVEKELTKHWQPEWFKEKNIYDWLNEETTIPYLELDVYDNMPWPEIFKEAQAVKDQCVVHREYSGGGTWLSGCLHGLGTEYTNTWDSYDEFKHLTEDQVEYKWTKLAEQCPVTTEYFKNVFPFREYKRLRFMWVEPGGYILPHRDNDQRTLSPVNVSIYNPAGCEFRYKNWGTVPFTNGSAFLIDVGQEHAVWNRSNESRLHIICHGRRKNPEWKQLLLKSWQKFGYGKY